MRASPRVPLEALTFRARGLAVDAEGGGQTSGTGRQDGVPARGLSPDERGRRPRPCRLPTARHVSCPGSPWASDPLPLVHLPSSSTSPKLGPVAARRSAHRWFECAARGESQAGDHSFRGSSQQRGGILLLRDGCTQSNTHTLVWRPGRGVALAQPHRGPYHTTAPSQHYLHA